MCPSGRSAVADSSTFRPAFDVLDADRDGKISPHDLRAFYAQKDLQADDDLIGMMMTVADTNRDGFVEYDEFERVVLGKRNHGGASANTTSFMEDVFRVMDKDGDGRLSHQDLKSFMEMAGFQVTDDDIDAMIKLGGGHQNGGVTFQGLHRILNHTH